MTDRQTDPPYRYWFDRVVGIGRYKTKENIPSEILNLDGLEKIMQNQLGKGFGEVMRTARVLGWWTRDNKVNSNINPGDRSILSMERYKFFLEAPFEISSKCCDVMKKAPIHKFAKETGRVAITAQMADESRLRLQKWLQHGCNAFETKNPISNPMSFWTEQDVLQYIKNFDLQICEVYGDVVTDDEITGQMTLQDFDSNWDMGRVPLKTTGCDRTGCVLCGFGCHLEKSGEGRFPRLKETHPGMYGLLDKIKNNGITYREAIEWTNQHLKRGHIEL